jgi:UDPglucose 6-dehydrogenase
MISVSVFGLGKLGLPLAALLAARGYKVFGYDHSPAVRDKLISRDFDFEEPSLNEILSNSVENIEIVSTPEQAVLASSIGFVIVPTPSLENGKFSNESVLELFAQIGPAIRKKDSRFVVDLVSTVMPGDSENFLIPKLCSSGGIDFPKDFGFTYNPEFIALGSVIHNMEYPDMQLLGHATESDGELIGGVLSSLALNEAPISKMTILEAEVVKISVNNFVTMKISFINSIMQACLNFEKANIKVIADAIGQDSRIGHKYLNGGAPYGGPCFPRDTRALAVFLDEASADSSLPRSTDLVNKSHNKFLSEYIFSNCNSDEPRILLVGISYKENTRVIEESPSLAIGKILTKLGAKVSYWNPISIPDPTSIGFNSGIESLRLKMTDCDTVVLCRNLSDCSQGELELLRSSKNVIDLWDLS